MKTKLAIIALLVIATLDSEASIGSYTLEQLQNMLDSHWSQYNALDPLTWFAIWWWIVQLMLMILKFMGK